MFGITDIGNFVARILRYPIFGITDTGNFVVGILNYHMFWISFNEVLFFFFFFFFFFFCILYALRTYSICVFLFV